MINVGIIGAGRIGRVHGESISKFVKNAQVKAIADPFLNDNTKAWAQSMGIQEAYTQLQSYSRRSRSWQSWQTADYQNYVP